MGDKQIAIGRICCRGKSFCTPALAKSDAVKFATYMRDGVSGLDYAVNRYHMPGQGKFATADPYQASGGTADPGSWNRYSYVEGDPVNLFDPQGQDSYTFYASTTAYASQVLTVAQICQMSPGYSMCIAYSANAIANMLANAGGGGGPSPPCGPKNPGPLTTSQTALLGGTPFSSLPSAQQLIFLTITAVAASLGISFDGLILDTVSVASPSNPGNTELILSGDPTAISALLGAVKKSGDFSCWPNSPLVGRPHDGYTGNCRQNTPTNSLQVTTNSALGFAELDIDPNNPNSYRAPWHWGDVARHNATGNDTDYGVVSSQLGKKINIFNCP
jgi:RHS repeat-associated protein